MGFTPPKHGSICWRELRTKDLSKATDFYRELLGCKVEVSKGSEELGYMEISNAERPVGGIMPITKTWGEGWENIPSHWVHYVAVDNCDETAAMIVENGGKLIMPPIDAPRVGRMATASDPSGAVFSVMQFEKR